MAVIKQLPILTLGVREQRYSCHGCGNCCRDFSVQLREEDLRKLREQNWEAADRLGRPVTIEFRGTTFLRQTEDGACVFLMNDGKCRIHAEFGFENKPIACQLFPFHLTPSPRGIEAGVNFACQSVLENKGAELRSHIDELRRMGGELPELDAPRPTPMLNDTLRAQPREVESLAIHIDNYLQRREIDFSRRIDGLAWVIESLNRAKFDTVRGAKFEQLLDVLFDALPEELEHHPIEASTSRQRKMLRQAVFARTEDPKLHQIAKQGRLRITLSQLLRSRKFRVGRGHVPRIAGDWPQNVKFADVERVAPPSDLAQVQLIDDLMTRYLRATILGGRAWGAGYYGWPMVQGVQALLLNVASIGWLARVHAVQRWRSNADNDVSTISITIDDIRAALGRIDRTAGRARWLGSRVERLRLTYLSLGHGLRRVLDQYRINEPRI
jgi:lysine-N-methylase